MSDKEILKRDDGTLVEIDWDEVMKESEKYLELEKMVEEQIRQERKKPSDINDLIRQTERVNKYIEENNPFQEVYELKDEPNLTINSSENENSSEDFDNKHKNNGK